MPDQEEKREKVHRVFQKIYKKYDAMNSLISFNRHKTWRKKANQIISVQPGDRVIDVCCGTGDWTIALAEAAGSSGSVTGLDFSDHMLKIARQKQEMKQLGNIKLVHGDAMALPFADASFDRAAIGFGLRNVSDYLTVLKEINRVLRPGGVLVCLETSQTKIPVYRQLYLFYFRFVMPLLGKLFAGSYKEYAWLNESASRFPDQEKLAALFAQAGFQDVSAYSLMGGIAAIHKGIRPLT